MRNELRMNCMYLRSRFGIEIERGITANGLLGRYMGMASRVGHISSRSPS
jgi:hypothetical protein